MKKKGKEHLPFPKRFVTLCDQTTNCKPMDKGTTNSGLPVFGEIIKLLDKQRINTLADKMKANRYTKRLDAYQHLVIMLYAQLGQFESLRDIELGFLCAASRRKRGDRFLFHFNRYIRLFPIPVNLSNCRREALRLFNSINTDLFISSGNC